MFARGGATRGPLHPLRGRPRAWALEWERWISLRWLFGDSNTVVSSRWGLGGLRHFSGALRPFRHSSRGLPSGSAIWCPSSLRCAEAHYSGFVGRASSMWLLGEYGIFLFCSPRFWVVGFFFCARFPPREASLTWGAAGGGGSLLMAERKSQSQMSHIKYRFKIQDSIHES